VSLLDKKDNTVVTNINPNNNNTILPKIDETNNMFEHDLSVEFSNFDTLTIKNFNKEECDLEISTITKKPVSSSKIEENTHSGKKPRNKISKISILSSDSLDIFDAGNTSTYCTDINEVS
jgi:hypothetical protein